MSNKIKLKRGLSSNINSVILDDGEVALTTDTNKLYSKKGEIAPNNVYVGTSEPSDNNIECWINPDGQSSSIGTNITLAKMNTYGKQSVASGATAFVTSWTETTKIEIGDFECDVANGRIKIPAGTAKHIRITGLIAGSGYFFGGCYVLDENNETPENFYFQSAGILIQSAGNGYFKEPLPTYVHEITDTTKDYYVKLKIGGYNDKTFILNDGFGSLSSYILVEKVD